MLCRELKLFTEAVVAIDGNKIKAVNNRERNYTPGKIERRERELPERRNHSGWCPSNAWKRAMS